MELNKCKKLTEGKLIGSLELLDLSNNNILDFTDIVKIISSTLGLKTLNIKGNFIESSNQLDQLIRGLIMNISVESIHFDMNDMKTSSEIDE